MTQKELRKIAGERLGRRALQRLRGLEPVRGQMRAVVEVDEMPMSVSPPNDPYGYGPGIMIYQGRLVGCSVEEIVEEYGEEFFRRKIWPELREFGREIECGVMNAE